MRTATTRKRRAPVRRSGRVRCRLCGLKESKRFCPAVNTQICPSCCSEMRGKRVECNNCKYNLVRVITSRETPQPELKFYSAMVSDSEKSGVIDLAVAWEKPNGRLKVMFFLLDFWKSGMEECFVDVDISKEEFEQRSANMGGRAARKLSLDDARKLIKRALTISEAAGIPIPWDYQHWRYLLGDMNHIPGSTGSLYKCARCGAELNEPVVEVIRSHAHLKDAHFYMVCEKCAGEFED